MEILPATPADVPAVEALLRTAGLSLEGAAAAIADLGVVAREGGGVVAAAAVEAFGSSGLLRSVVVAEAARGRGVGTAIVAAAEAAASARGIRDLYLLTETAPAWFPRLGYAPIPRADAEAAVGASVELTTVCRDTGVAMRRTFG